MPMTETPAKQSANFQINLLIENTEGMYVGWSIETGIAATGLTPADCLKTLVELNCEHIAFALENDNGADIFHSAPSDVLTKFTLFAKENAPVQTGDMASGACHPLFSVSPAVYASARI